MGIGRGAAFGVGWLLLAAPAHAQVTATPAARLVFRRASGTERCPDEPELRETVAARLGFDPFVTDPARTITVTFARTGRSTRSRVELRAADGSLVGARSFVSTRADCSDLGAATALAVSIAIDPLASTRVAASPAPVASSAPPPPSPTPSDAPSPASVVLMPPVASAAPPPPAAPVHHGPDVIVQAFLGGGLAVGSTPSPTVAFSAGLGFRIARFALALEGRVDLPQSASVQGLGTVSASLALAAIVPCFRQPFAGGRFAVLGCAVGYVGALEGSSPQVAAATLYVAVGARGAFEAVLVGPLSVRALAELTTPLTTTRLEIADPHGTLQPVWTTPSVAFEGGVSAVLSFL